MVQFDDDHRHQVSRGNDWEKANIRSYSYRSYKNLYVIFAKNITRSTVLCGWCLLISLRIKENHRARIGQIRPCHGYFHFFVFRPIRVIFFRFFRISEILHENGHNEVRKYFGHSASVYVINYCLRDSGVRQFPRSLPHSWFIAECTSGTAACRWEEWKKRRKMWKWILTQ